MTSLEIGTKIHKEIEERINIFADDLIKSLKEVNPNEFDTSFNKMNNTQKTETLKLAGYMIARGWTKNAPTEIPTPGT